MGREIHIEGPGKERAAVIESMDGTKVRVRVDDRVFECEVINRQGGEMLVRVGTKTIVVHEVKRGEYVVGSRVIRVSDRMQDSTDSGAGSRADKLKAVMPGMVVKVLVEVGDEVKAGTPVLVLEAMKMENEVKSPGDGRVKAIKVKAGETVDTGAVLVEFE